MKQANTTTIFTLLKVASRIERKLDRALSCTKGVSFTEYSLLKELLEKYQGSATRVDLADAVSLTPSAITRALKPLEKIGLVLTEKSDRDARRSLAILTPAGRTLLSDANKIVHDEINALGLSESELTKLQSILDRL